MKILLFIYFRYDMFLYIMMYIWCLESNKEFKSYTTMPLKIIMFCCVNDANELKRDDKQIIN